MTSIAGVPYSAHRQPMLDAVLSETYTLTSCEKERGTSVTVPWGQGERHSYRTIGNPGATTTSDRSAAPSMRDITEYVPYDPGSVQRSVDTMPELPEVETIRRGLAERLSRQTITAVRVRQAQLRHLVDIAALQEHVV